MRLKRALWLETAPDCHPAMAFTHLGHIPRGTSPALPAYTYAIHTTYAILRGRRMTYHRRKSFTTLRSAPFYDLRKPCRHVRHARYLATG